MEKKKYASLTARLFERKKELVGSAQSGEKRDLSVDGRAKDTGDEALEISMERLESSMLSSVVDEIRMIDQALERIEAGSYGICIDCGNKISEARLECFPYAARCIICQEKFEA